MKNQMGEDQLLVPSSITTNSTATRTSVPPISQQLVAAERKAARPPAQKEQPALHCPRCKSSNTKFCYYNNYSLTQPRYICKACRRYWTEGGSLRNVPVGGGSRKNKRHSSAASTASAAIPSSNINNHQIPSSSPPPSSFPTTSQPFNQVHDLNLAYPNYNHNFVSSIENGSMSGISHMELLRRSTTRGLGPLMPMHMPMSTSMAPLESSGAGVLHAAGLFPFEGSVGSGMQEGGRRLMFPFGSDLKQEQHRGHGGDQQPMFWNGMMGGGGHAGDGSW